MFVHRVHRLAGLERADYHRCAHAGWPAQGTPPGNMMTGIAEEMMLPIDQ